MKRDTEDDRDPLLEAGLAEIFGGATPPDLASRILKAWQAQQAQLPSSANGTSLTPGQETSGQDLTTASQRPVPYARPLPWATVLTPGSSGNGELEHHGAENGNGTVLPGRALSGGPPQERAARRAASRLWTGSLVAVVLLAAGVGIAVMYRARFERAGEPPVAHDSPRADQPQGHLAPPLIASEDHSPAPSGLAERGSERPPSSVAKAPGIPEQLEPPFGPTAPVGPGDNPPTPAGPVLVQGRSGLPSPWSSAEVVAAIDRELRQAWVDQGLTASDPASDTEWCRRAFVRLLGRIPTVPELQNFVQAAGPDKREQLVSQLIDGSHYANEFAIYWASFWANSLLGRTAGLQPGDLANREGFERYLRDAIAADRPFHELVYELVAATGAPDPDSPEYNGAVNYLLAHHSKDGSVETAAISRHFLGQRFQCAQCHDHPGNEALAQRDFWQFNALLRQVHVQRDRAAREVRLTDRDLAEEAVFFEQLDGVKRAAFPVLPDGRELPRSGRVADGRRREILARYLAQSDALPQVLVNRVWAHFFGYGLTRPIDEIGTHNPASHPELLRQLSTQFAAHDYRLKELTKWLALSDAFQRSSKFSEGNLADAPERGEQPWFSRYYLRQMQPEAVFDSLRLVAEARRRGENSTERLAFLGQFAHRLGTDDGEEANLFQGDIRQSFLLMTGPLMQQALNDDGAVLGHVLSKQMSPEEKISHLFLASVGRPPSQRELEQCLKMLEANPQPEEALQDIWWALLNSNEFILDR